MIDGAIPTEKVHTLMIMLDRDRERERERERGIFIGFYTRIIKLRKIWEYKNIISTLTIGSVDKSSISE